jgi:hypothetical protein
MTTTTPLDEQEPDVFRRFRHCLEFAEDAPIEAVIEAAIGRLDYDLHLVTENSRRPDGSKPDAY